MDEVQVNVTQTPSLVLLLCLRESMIFAMVVVPQLGDNEDFFTLDDAFLNGTLDTLTGLALVLVVIGTVEKAVPDFDGLFWVSLCEIRNLKLITLRCKQCLQLGPRALSRDRSQPEASRGQRPA